MHNTIAVKRNIFLLRKLMRQESVDSYIIPHNDETLSEYVPKNKERLNWISGFSGSAGTFFVTSKKLLLFTDGRYTLQAKNQTSNLGCEIIDISKTTLLEYIEQNSNKFKCVGIDSRTMSMAQFDSFEKTIIKAKLKLKVIEKNLIDILWKRNLRVQNSKEIFFLPNKFTGESSAKKLKKINAYLNKHNANFIFVQDSESIAWLYNLRGKDLPHTPITFCLALIGKDKQNIFFEDKNIPNKLTKNFGKYASIHSMNKLSTVLSENCHEKTKIITDYNKLSLFNFNLLKKNTKIIYNKSDILLKLRAIKNSTEINFSKKAHILDAVSMCKFLYWFKNYSGNLSELDVVEKINNLRSRNEGFICTSFPTIAGSGKNGAIIHYQPNQITNKMIKKTDILLLDSGGQYFYGTTDVTRTISRSKNISNKIKANYTAVLKSHLGLNLSRFPSGTPCYFLDLVARKTLWDIDEDFAHSTGHGVGFCLNVHEGPFSISMRNKHPLLENMIFSNEPGIYKNGEYGIRIENLVFTKKAKKNSKSFLEIETLTLVPYDRDLINTSLLNKSEKNWLNNYHKSVVKNISPYLNKREKEWLKIQCKKI